MRKFPPKITFCAKRDLRLLLKNCKHFVTKRHFPLAPEKYISARSISKECICGGVIPQSPQVIISRLREETKVRKERKHRAISSINVSIPIVLLPDTRNTMIYLRPSLILPLERFCHRAECVPRIKNFFGRERIYRPDVQLRLGEHSDTARCYREEEK